MFLLKALICVEGNCFGWLKLVKVQLTVFDGVFSALAEKILEIMQAKRLAHCQANPVPIRTSLLGLIFNIPPLLRWIMDMREWRVVGLNLDDIWRRPFLISLWMMPITTHLNDDFGESWYKLHVFGVRCMSAHSHQSFSILLLKISLKWRILRLTSVWWKLIDECGWVVRQWYVVKLTCNEWLQITWMYFALESWVFRLTLIYKIDGVR